MRIVEKMLYGIGGLLALVLLFIAFCHYNPDIAVRMGQNLVTDTKNETSDKSVGKSSGIVYSEDIAAADISAGMISDDKALYDTQADVPTELSVISSVDSPDMSQSQTGLIPFAEVKELNVVEVEKERDADTKASTGDKAGEKGLSIPANVEGLNGYVPVQAIGTEVTQKKADEILNTLDAGETGEGLSFDAIMYPYYDMISDTEKALYRQIYANANAMNKKFKPLDVASANEVRNAFRSVVNDHPELFWVETAYKYKYAPTGQVAEIGLVFNITANDIDASKAKFEEAAKYIKDNTYGLYTDYEKEKKVHDTLIANVVYDANSPMNQSAYSALVYGRTVCAGYSRAYQYVMQQLDIPCYYVTGYAGENHAWNIVKLDDGYYNVDSTWADTNPSTYNYFNCSDSEYKKDHVRRDLAINLPPCNAGKYSDLEVNPPVVSKPSNPTPQTPQKNNNDNNNNNTQNDNNSNNSQSQGITVQTVIGGGDNNYIDNIQDYYIACFEKMMSTDKSNPSFSIIISDEKLWDKIYKEYAKGKCQEGYIERYLVEKHKNSCVVTVEPELRSDGSYILRHYANVN